MPGTRHTYAQNVLVLWSPFKDYVDDQGQVLRRNQFQRLSVASPNRVYGRPAAQVLDNLGLARRSRTSWSNATTSRSRANSSRPAAPTWGS
ncbi:substrate-binding domain-containing protein [Bordetella parapertussis]|uniref:substrate-binding domain-containing protein n=1 Tax=Bordetella parapertussis TaxID=519 RepID=UPI001F406CF2|nr:substrate-binding domain-containing protein [Bordetella parapertussis]